MENTIVTAQLEQLISRIEKLNEDKANILADIRDIYTEAQNAGFDKKAVREIVKLRKKDADEREQEDEIMKMYRSALGL
jgi:uncharacterized protein (UPF0335 family)